MATRLFIKYVNNITNYLYLNLMAKCMISVSDKPIHQEFKARFYFNSLQQILNGSISF